MKNRFNMAVNIIGLKVNDNDDRSKELNLTEKDLRSSLREILSISHKEQFRTIVMPELS